MPTDTPIEPLYLEDLTPGRVFRAPGETTVEAEAVKRFAREFDPQPFHTDEVAAARTFFGGLVASGWHTVGMTMRHLLDALPIAGGLVGAGIEEIRWPVPVRPGDVLRAEVEILSARPSQSRPTQGLATIRVTTRNGRDETVQVLVAVLVVPRRSPG